MAITRIGISCGVTPGPEGDIKRQTRQGLERIDRLLQAAG